ncbi:MAG: DNA repair helicase [Bacteroidetes bacterium]|nr:MAG: DNA repair helicase [Bacteroidota bacterium]
MLISEITSVLLERSPLNKHQLLNALKAKGVENCSTPDINRVLYGNRNLFVHNGQSLPLWSLIGNGTIVHEDQLYVSKRSPDNALYQGHQPRSWQMEALSGWISQGKRGVIEAVTGTGKSLVGILAAADALARGLKVLIIVPGIELQKQWHDNIEKYLPTVRVGKFCNGHKDTFHSIDLIISTVHSARKYQMLPPAMRGLIIVDEVHGSGTEKNALAFEDEFTERLGLTATYERTDNGLDVFVTPYFKPLIPGFESKTVIPGCDYARGLHDGILAPFRVGLLGVPFAEEEEMLYEQLEKSLSKMRADLVRLHGCQPEPFGEFIRAVHHLGEGGHQDYAGTKTARKYLTQFNARKDLLANSQLKLRTFRQLIPMISVVNKCLVFTGFISTAKEIERMLVDDKIPTSAFSSELSQEERTYFMNEFKTGKLKVLAAPAVLDEGIDVPEAELGIILSANHSKRQMIQRMGRIIRPKKDGRPATFFILYIENTNEDPAMGAHESFLTEMIDHAAEVRDFGNSYDASEFLDWYIDGKLGR